METVKLSQTDLAKVLDVKQPTLSEATSEGHKVKDYPVQAWANYDSAGRVTGYEVPFRVMSRVNPANSEEVVEEVKNKVPVEANGQAPQRESKVLRGATPDLVTPGQTWPGAITQVGPAVTGNVGGTVVAHEFIGLLKENPTLADYLLDLGLPILLASLGVYATEPGEDYRIVKVGGLSIGGWGVVKVVRGLFTQNTGHERRTTEERMQSQSALGGGQRQQQNVDARSERLYLPQGVGDSRGGGKRGGGAVQSRGTR